MFETGDKSYEYHKMLKIAIILHHQKVVNKTTTKGDHKALTLIIKLNREQNERRAEVKFACLTVRGTQRKTQEGHKKSNEIQ